MTEVLGLTALRQQIQSIILNMFMTIFPWGEKVEMSKLL